ncbi:MAG: hypothetical protein NTX22_10315 [Ignavibacteriales bacterium]|nr:hypothetical protein [Ignavibacteriales bacterium]
MIKNKILIIFLLTVAGNLFAQTASFDWKLHDVGNVRQVVTNRGGFNAKGDNTFSFRGLINCEHPPNSGVEHMTNSGITIGGIYGGVRSVSVSDGESGNTHEFYPTDEPWDTVWVVGRRDTVDIPYWKKYVGISDQDFVCRYNDYGPISQKITDHRPLYIDVIQTSHAWATKPLDESIVVDWYIIPTQYNLEDVYVGVYLNGNVGYVFNGTDYALDDQSFWSSKDTIQFAEDVPGGVDGNNSMLGEKFFCPRNKSNSLTLTYIWWNGGKASPPALDNDKYIQMGSGEQMEDQASTGDGTKSQLSFGPYESVKVGDTLHVTMAIILGWTENEISGKAQFLEKIRPRYRVPSPPPSPKVRVVASDQKITLNWEAQPGDVNPEEFLDPDRSDGIKKSFEGYKVYKSTESKNGPWTLLGQYDLTNNYGQNTGLVREFTDEGLLNNIEYYYAVTAYTIPDTKSGFPELESGKTVSSLTVVPGTPPPPTVGKVAVVPNPYRGDVAYNTYSPPWEKPGGSRKEWMEQDRRIQFINLPDRCEIKVYTIAGDLVTTIRHESITRGYEDWNITSSVGQAISSGIYLYTVQDLNNGKVQVDKFVILK